ncbi:MAG: hypothetical protein O2910_07690, partial [Proteobacteria bacterium]|nr:hypothetical protein [Pseudomonadota bacterium]
MTEKLSRRSLLKRGAGGVTVLVLGGLVWRAWDNGVFSIGEGPAYEPWHNWQDDEGDALLGIVRAGILAANAHNTQPWRFVIRDQQIEVYADTARNLGAFDPYLREMHVSLGCAVENMRLAALAAGLTPDISLPAGTLLEAKVQPADSPAAILNLTPGEANADQLYSQIPHRHTSRGHYVAGQTLSADQRTELLSAAAAFDDVEVLL